MRTFEGTERYTVERVLGEGHFGVVYQCIDQLRGTRVALKTLRAIDGASLAQLKSEFRATARIVHPNIALLYELESDGERWFFTMEFVDGTDLAARVRETPAGSPARIAAVRPWLLQLARAVAALHRGQTLHRDIKPSNVMVTRDGRVVVVDFGLSIDMHDDPSDSMVGSAAYIAPEIADRAAPSRQTDWYSYGVVLFQAITDRLPFEGRSLSVLLDKSLRDAPSLRKLAPEVPEGLEKLCERLLARDPSARPGADEVIAACESNEWLITEQNRGSLTTYPLAVEGLLGRDGAMELLRCGLADARCGQSVTLRVIGDSGVGKSALTRQFVAELREVAGATVFKARCYERETVPFKALDGLVDAIVESLAIRDEAEVKALLPPRPSALCRLFPALCALGPMAAAATLAPEVAADPGAQRRDAVASFEVLLRKLAQESQLVIVLDDVQWGDAESAALLAQLMARVSGVLLVTCDRGDLPAPCRFIAALKAVGIAPREIPIGPLGAEQSASLALLLLPAEARRHAAFVARESAGNPFLVGEFARLASEGFSFTDEPITLDALWRARFTDLTPSAWALLSCVSVAARPIEESVALRAAALCDNDRAASRECQAARLLWATLGPSNTLVTSHDRVRDAVVAQLSPEALAAQHRSLARALERDGRAEPETLAVHHEAGGDIESARSYLSLAASRAMRALAFERAVELYRRALSLSVTEAGERRALGAALAEALASAGRGPEAAMEYLQACEGADPTSALQRRLCAADALIRSGHIDVGMPLLREVMVTVGLKMPSSPALALASLALRRVALWRRGMGYSPRPESSVPVQDLLRLDAAWTVASALGVIDVVRAADVQSLHLKLSLEAGEPFRVARSLAVEAASRASRGEAGAEQATEIWESAVAIAAIAAREGNPTAIGITTAMQSLGHWCMGHWQYAFELGEQALTVLGSRCTGVSWELAQTLIVALDSMVYLGRWGAMGERALRVIGDARNRGDLYLETVAQMRFGSRDALRRDDTRAAERSLDAVARWTHSGFDSVRLVHVHERMALDLYQGSPERALIRWYAALRDVRGSYLLRVQLFRIVWTTSRATAHVMSAWQHRGSERGPQRELASRWIGRLAAERSGWARSSALALKGSVLAMDGRSEVAARLMAEASAGFDALGMSIHAASARAQQGRLTGGHQGRGFEELAGRVFSLAGVRSPERVTQMIVPMG